MARKKSLKMDFRWDYSKDAIVERLGFGKDLNRKFAETLVKFATPYTPYAPKKKGSKTKKHLRQAVQIRATKNRGIITYPGIPYDKYQYFSDDSGWNRHTQGTTSRWLDYAWMVNKPQITGTVGAYRRWHSV